VVNRVCRFLADAGYLTARGDTDGGTWMARPRFRHAVATLCEDSDLYPLITGLADVALGGGDTVTSTELSDGVGDVESCEDGA
jgi:hypothetical protein